MNRLVCAKHHALSALIILIGVICIDGKMLPCYFFDSINITDGIRHTNGSITFDGVHFPRNQYAVLNYIVDNGERKRAKNYIRGCLCNVKPCFRFCCSDELVQRSSIDLDENCNEELTQMEGEVFDERNKVINLYLDNEQPIQVKNRTCKQFFIQEDILERIENVRKPFRQNKTTTVRGYCQSRINDETDQDDLNVSICIDWVEQIQPDTDSNSKILLDYLEHISMLISVPLLFATFLVYICLPDLHKNLHGKCFICYLLCQMSCFILEILSYRRIFDWEPVIIYLFLCAFQWLNVTAFDAWWNLRHFRNNHTTNKSSQTKRFLLYMAYALLSPFLLNIFQICSNILKSIKIDPEKVDELEVAGFICTTFTINIIFFVLTALKICQANKEIGKLTSREDSRRHRDKLNTERGNFRMYLRLFIVMGMTYSISGISYLFRRYSVFSEWTEICLSLQGVWIFILFVMKRRTIVMIRKRWSGEASSSTKRSTPNNSGNESDSRLK